ncbi:imm68 putative immunity domain-containing protein [Paenibacillus sp. HWE-109]|uniref:imm68 putative immunity domain-containing protein n=1 Tax=Paenibacillus sp. HWE-109 TaxID=1306526 RepID=UPI001EDEC8F8|nr:imm68 putative immunity domain-containing protein [Paenibacillus sp. HWE-109]UKS29587.1 imm68 putative immunity domain-containing protein [Paenibacillus sp. HWE-109]
MYISQWWGDLIGGSDDSLALIDYLEQLDSKNVTLNQILKDLGFDILLSEGDLRNGGNIGFDRKSATAMFRVELDIACGVLIDLSAIVLESLKSGYVDLHDLDEARQPCKLYIDASEENRNLLRDELNKFSRNPLSYDLAELVPTDDMRELAEKAKMIADELL